ncbi:hypothetical protein B0H14DRAFT_3139413, partial [Mycena olivaceomarginata]
MAMYVPLAPHDSSSPAGPQHGPALVFPLALHLAPLHCRLRRTCVAHVQPPALAGYSKSNVSPDPHTATADAAQAQADLEADRSARDEQGRPRVVCRCSSSNKLNW